MGISDKDLKVSESRLWHLIDERMRAGADT
jgi:hypothetical protein